jgi:deoxycytidine triphosphate deaminase
VGMKIGQYAFETIEGKVEVPYNVRPSTKYVGQLETEISRIKGDN